VKTPKKQFSNLLVEIVEFCELVLREALGGKEIERARICVSKIAFKVGSCSTASLPEAVG